MNAIVAARRTLLAAMHEPAVVPADLVSIVRSAVPQGGPRGQELARLMSLMDDLARIGGSERRVLYARALRLLATMEGPSSTGTTHPNKAKRRERRGAEQSAPLGPSDPVERLAGIGERASGALRAKGLFSIEDLALLIPRTYDDRRQLVQIAELSAGSRSVVRGQVAQSRWVGRGRFEALLEDDSGRLRLVFFRVFPWQTERLRVGRKLIVSGDVTAYQGRLQMAHPDMEPEDVETSSTRTGRIVPVYPEIAGVGSRLLERSVRLALSAVLPALSDGLPPELARRRDLPGQREALAMLHEPHAELPPSELQALREGTSLAHRRLRYDEFFFLSLGILRRRIAARRQKAHALSAGATALERLRAELPFALTEAQQRVCREIQADLERDEPMQRLLQGDVGSGKTLVALSAIITAAASGAQSALMVPTEILAEQHLRALSPLLGKLGFRAVLLVGSQRAKARREALRALELGSAQLAIGTHALLSEGVSFQRLALAVVDEQHRFGVAQRLRLIDKGSSAALGSTPHLLVMTATPIPRTLALTVHGDLDLSVIDEMPAGRMAIDTRLLSCRRLDDVIAFLGRAIERGERGYFICPLIDGGAGSRSVARDLAAASERSALLSDKLGRDHVGLLHGQLRPEDKEAVMDGFLSGKVQVLVSTTVVEVGIDVPEATFTVIDGAERFGLSQLHQLRGRVGRGTAPSCCLLMTSAQGESLDRLECFVAARDGFEVAEADLSTRGPGEIFGLRQSGLPGFRFGDLLRDAALLAQARCDAQELLASDPELGGERLASTRKVLETRFGLTGSPVAEEAG